VQCNMNVMTATRKKIHIKLTAEQSARERYLVKENILFRPLHYTYSLQKYTKIYKVKATVCFDCKIPKTSSRESHD
jgi:hypothetical protein